jgi:uncharacterized protein (DUF302 family)
VTSSERSAAHSIVTKDSPRSVRDTVSRLIELIGLRGMKVFTVIDQAAEARTAGLQLRETVLVVFGNPALGTAVMSAVPLAALDLPLKILIWADDEQTKVSYLDPDALTARHGLGENLAHSLAGINALSDVLVAAT